MDRRINTAQNIYLNNVSVDEVYYNNELIWPQTPWSPNTDITTTAWIDASDSSNYSTSGTTLTSVTDKSGTYTVTVGGTPTVGNTQNGLNVFDFDGNNEYLQSTTYSAQVSSVTIGQLVYLDLKELIVLKILFGVMKQINHQKEIMQSVVVTHQTLGQVN